MNKRDAARWLALRGFPVVPLIAGGKIPSAKGWKELASKHPADAWDNWTRPDGEPSDNNIGVVASEHVILDVDVPGESHATDGRQALASLGWSGRTFTVRTPSGGLHLYFKKPAGHDYAQNDLAPGINVRSSGGFVVGPGSYTKHIPGKQVAGAYVVVDDTPPVELPDIIRAGLTPAGSARRFDESSYQGEWDHPQSVAWCWRYVHEYAPTAEKGERGAVGLVIAHMLGDRAITKDTALVMLQEWHESKCDPPSDDENQMEHVLNSAYSNRQRPFGIECTHEYLEPVEVPRSASPISAPVVQPPPKPFAQRVRKSRVRCAEDLAKIPPIPWLVRGKLIRGAITGLVSPPGVGKSTLTLQWACALATGDGHFTALSNLENAEPVNSMVIGIEDTVEVMEGRLGAMCYAFGLDYQTIAERVHIYSGTSDGELKLLAKKDKRSMLSIAEDAAGLQAYVTEHNIGCVFVDPLVEIHDGEENDNGEMRRVMAALRSLATSTGSAVVIVHHTRKPPQASSESFAGDQFAGRGASSIPAAFRLGLTLFTMSAKDAEKYGIPEHEQGEYVRLDDSKANWSKLSPYATWFKRAEVQLGNGESAAILKPIALSASDDKSAELLASDIAEILSVGVAVAVSSVAAALMSKPLYKDKSERTLRRRIREIFVGGPIKTGKGLVTFSPSGREGGSVILTL